MVYLDWKRILAIKPDTFTDDEKDELLDSVMWFSPAPDTNVKEFTALVVAIQEILKYKVEQVESLLTALDEMAVKQGEEFARGRQDLIEEIRELQEQLEYQKRIDRESGFSDDQMRSELVRLEVQNDEMVSELQEREKELVSERAQVEKLTDQVNRLERERTELARELEACREESTDHRRDSGSFGGSSEKVEELVELVRQKNRHIMQLLEDIEILEAGKNAIEAQLKSTQDELFAAKINVGEVQSENAKLKVNVADFQNKSQEKETRIAALTVQIQELVQQKLKHEQDLDDFAIKLDARVEEWKRLLDSKDNEIMRLKGEKSHTFQESLLIRKPAEKAHPVEQSTQQEIALLRQKVEQLESQCQERMAIAEKYKSKLDEMKSDELTEKNKDLEEKLATSKELLRALDAEVEAKSKEISEVVSELRAYERGEFGLSDAIDKIKKLEKKIVSKNKELENFVATCNQLEIDKGNLEEENETLREKLGMSPSHVVDITGQKVNKSTVIELKSKVEQLSNEIIELKMKNRELQRGKSTPQPATAAEIIDDNSLEEIQANYQMVLEENDAMRKGLQDVLQSIQTQSMGEIQATSLERLLEALDMRHISGWYHPAMRLQAQLYKISGEGNELRARINALSKENQTLLLEAARSQGSNDRICEDEPNSNVPPQAEEIPVEEKTDVLPEPEIVPYNEKWELDEFQHEQEETKQQRELRALKLERDRLLEKVQTLTGNSDFHDLATEREQELESELNQMDIRYFEMKERLLCDNINLRKENSTGQLKIQELTFQLQQCTPNEDVAKMQNELAHIKIKFNTAFTEHFSQRSSVRSQFHQAIMEQIEKIMFYRDQKAHEAASSPVGESEAQIFLEELTTSLRKIASELESSGSEDSGRAINEKLEETMRALEGSIKLEAHDFAKGHNQWEIAQGKRQIDQRGVNEFLNLYKSLYRSILQGRKGEFVMEEAAEEKVEDDTESAEECDSGPVDCEVPVRDLLLKHIKLLHAHLEKMHSVCQCALGFPSIETAAKIMSELKKNQELCSSELQRVSEKEHQLLAKSEELDIQLATLNELKAAMTTDPSSLVNWHNKTTEMKLLSSRHERQNTQLREQLEKAEKQVLWYKHELKNLEDEALYRERNWLEVQKSWETAQLEILCQVGNPSPKSSSLKGETALVGELQKKVEILENENSELVKEAKHKEVVFAEILATQARKSSKDAIALDISECPSPSYDKSAVGRMLTSLQTIIKQKEDQIVRYQELMEKMKSEYRDTSKRLQEDLRNVHGALAQQSKAYSRLKNGMYQPARVDLEKFVLKIQSLEEELAEARNAGLRIKLELEETAQEERRWREMAMDSQNKLEDTKERFESEIQRLQDELAFSEEEIKKWRSLAHGDKSLIDKINQLQVQISSQHRSDVVSANENSCQTPSHETLERRLEASREECSRLRKQIEVLNRIKQPTSALRPAEKNEPLVSKIKKLEETLELSKQHEKELEEARLKKIRSAEEVARWEERKRHEKTLEKLKMSLKQKEVEADIANKKLESFRGLMGKVERERNLLEVQVRNLTESVRDRCAMGNLMTEKQRLEDHVNTLEAEIFALREERRDSDRSASELSKLSREKSSLRRRNGELEKENQSLKEQIGGSNQNQVLNTIETPKRNRTTAAHIYESQREMSKARERIQKLNERITHLTVTNENLVEEIKRLRTQLELWEEKDLAQTLSRTKAEQTISELRAEGIQMKAELAHKSHLLGRVKVLLCRAAAKEKALNEKVSVLQSGYGCS